jgi:AmmeMemoRadiSam system protein B
MTRQPVVADRFYPGNPAELRALLSTYISDEEKEEDFKAIVMPHAGYVYSGATAGKVISKARVPQTVILIGPNHTGRGARVALSTLDWEIGSETIPLDRQLADLLLDSSSQLVADDLAHSFEHSLEVQIPFLHYKQPNLKIVPVSVSNLSYHECSALAREFGAAVKAYNKPVLFVASTDMSHYLSREVTTRLDNKAIEKMLAFDAEGLLATVRSLNISMCGVLPTTITMLAAKELGGKDIRLVEYTDSGAASGDTDQVVGYAGLTIQ